MPTFNGNGRLFIRPSPFGSMPATPSRPALSTYCKTISMPVSWRLSPTIIPAVGHALPEY